MKKTIIILLVAVLATGSVFAVFSGSLSVSAGYNFETGDYGFFGNGTNAKINVDLGNQVAEKAGEGDIYASIKATLTVKVINDTFDVNKMGEYEWPVSYGAADNDQDLLDGQVNAVLYDIKRNLGVLQASATIKF